MLSVVLDTNILASSALTSSTTSTEILNKWRDGQFQLIISEHIIGELKQTLNKPYFRKLIHQQVIDDFVDLLRSEAIVVPITARVAAIATHKEDDMILATAESGKAGYLVTGDHGLQDLKEFKGIQIVSPRIFATILEKEKTV